MANPLAAEFYNGSLVKYTQIVASLLSDIKIVVEGRTVRLPLNYQGGIRDQSSTTYVVDSGLSTTLKISDFLIASEGVRSKAYTRVIDSAVKRPALPVEIFFDFRLRFKKFDDMARALELIVYQTYPHLTLNTEILDHGLENLVLSPEEYTWENEWTGTGEEPAYYELYFRLKLTGGHLYGGNLLDSNQGGNPDEHAIIEQVNIQVGILNTSVNDSACEPWFNVYGNEFNAYTRFRADVPLEPTQGAWLFAADQIPDIQLIASGDWVREDFR